MKISKEIKIGGTAVMAVIIIYCGIIFLKGLKMFSTDPSYYVEMKDVQGMPVSADVLANGYKVGMVKEITYNPASQNLVVRFEVDPSFSIPQGTSVFLSKEMLGATKMNLTLGENPASVIQPGDTIKGEASADIMTAAANMLPKVEALLPKIDSILTAFNNLANDPALANTLHNLESMSNELRNTTKDVNALMSKDVPQLMAKANSICSNLETTTANINQIDLAGMANRADATLANVQDMTFKINTSLNSKDNSLGLLLNDNKLMVHLDSTALNASLLLEDLRMNPKRYVHFSMFGKKDK